MLSPVFGLKTTTVMSAILEISTSVCPAPTLSIIIGLIVGILLFPAPDFSKSLLVGIMVPAELFPAFVSQSLLFLSFLVATFIPVTIWKLR